MVAKDAAISFTKNKMTVCPSTLTSLPHGDSTTRHDWTRSTIATPSRPGSVMTSSMVRSRTRQHRNWHRTARVCYGILLPKHDEGGGPVCAVPHVPQRAPEQPTDGTSGENTAENKLPPIPEMR